MGVDSPPPTPTATSPRSRTALRSSRHCPAEAARDTASAKGSAVAAAQSALSTQHRPDLVASCTRRGCQIQPPPAKFPPRAGPLLCAARAGVGMLCAMMPVRKATAAAVALIGVAALAGCGNKPKSAMVVCKELEAQGVAAGCRDHSTACKYARERVTFDVPGPEKKVGGHVLRFANEAQYQAMLKIAQLAKDRVIEAKGALTLVQFTTAAPADVLPRTRDFLATLPPIPASEVTEDPNCKKD